MTKKEKFVKDCVEAITGTNASDFVKSVMKETLVKKLDEVLEESLDKFCEKKGFCPICREPDCQSDHK